MPCHDEARHVTVVEHKVVNTVQASGGLTINIVNSYLNMLAGKLPFA